MAYVNPNSIMINPSGPGSTSHYKFSSNPPYHPSLQHSQMPDYWVLPGGDRLVHLHRSEKFTPKQETLPPITFSVGGWAGVRVKDILGYSGPPVVVDCANDTPMKQFGWRSTVISLEWPGYTRRTFHDPQNARIDLIKDNRPITRHQLAREICGTLKNYSVSAKNIRPDESEKRWALDDEHINPDDVFLFSIHYYRNQWVPEFYILI